MFKSSYQICTVFGIPIRLDFSLIVLFFLLVSQEGDAVYGIATGIVLLVSIVLHELGHSLAAMAFGCKVKDITLMIIGGCATLLSMPKKAWQECLVALAGPAVSLGLAVLGLFVLPGLVAGHSRNVAFFLYYKVGFLNAGLFLFNLLPAFPMDGGRVLRSFLQQFFMSKLRATWWASRIGRVIAGLMAAWAVFGWLFLHYSFWGDTFMLLLVAWFVYQSAEREYRMVQMEEGTAPRTPFDRFFRGGRDEPPPDDGKAVVSPPPYDQRGGRSRVDVKKEL